jgi:LuxR family transcriptional regulator, maltose regulon positive regulatory protein
MVETITAAASPALDHIIERPRLIVRLADGGGSRLSVLAAPAGYGKTTLARQWSQRQAGPVAWYRTTHASGDVALLAVQLDDLLASIAPELPREPGKVASIAAVNPSSQPLSRAIVRSFATLPRDVLLVVDEWEAAGTDEAEELLSTLVERLDIRFLITTRARPDWFTPRLQVYGEGLEIGVDELAMTDAEATQVLAAAGAVSGRARLMRTADGWPAVLGLAAMSGDVDFTSSRLLSHTLYDFLASELLAAAESETQSALMLLAVASVTEVEVARSLLGNVADEVIENALARGLLAITEGKSLSLHPLMRELLIRRFGEADPETRKALLTRCRRLLDARRSDEALSVAEAAEDAAFATEAIAAALDDLLAAGRTSSLQRWVTAARSAGAEGGLIDYAESEALFREGHFDHALAIASVAAQSLDSDLAARAHIVAARAALLTDRSPVSENHANSAATLAATARTHEDALWLRFIASRERQTPDLRQRLEDLEAALRPGVRQAFRSACAVMTFAEIEGGLGAALDTARAALELARDGEESIAHTALLSGYSYLLAMTSRYEESLRSAEKLATLAENSGMDFAVPYADMFKAVGYIGLRRFTLADRTLSVVERQTQDDPGGYFRGNLRIQRARLYASLGDIQRAVDALTLGPDEHNSRCARAAFAGWQALFSVIAGDSSHPVRMEELSQETGHSIEAAALFFLAQAVSWVRRGDLEQTDLCIDSAIETEVSDAVLIAVRSEPKIGQRIAQRHETRTWLKGLLARSRDTSLGDALGLRIPRPARQRQRLTPREEEVHELLAQGLTNDEIARLLYISLSTTKVHVKHIFEKLGVRSRLEAARALRGDV